MSTHIRSRLLGFIVYFAVCFFALSVATARLRAQGPGNDQAAPNQTEKAVAPKAYFQLSTNHTYGTTDRARVWINYQGIDHLDFRVYRVNDPVKFFAGLNNPHQVGEREKTVVAGAFQEKPSTLEKVRSFKVSIFKSIKNYFREQLHPESRDTLIKKFVAGAGRVPLNVADYARVPLLSQDQLVESWRQTLPVLENDYDTRMVLIGQRDPGVYLVEAVNNDLRAYTIAVVTDLTMVTKTSPDGGILVYAVDRKSGAPRQGVQVEAVKGAKRLASGATDGSGIFRTRVQVEKPKPQPEEPPENYDPEQHQSQVGRNDYLIMASNHDHFAISDLQPYYFGGGGGGEEDEEGGSPSDFAGYCYTDRPVYRPGQKVYFKAIMRRLGEAGYESIGSHDVHVTIEDPNGEKVLDKRLPVSAKGTVSGDLDIVNGAPLGGYRINVMTPEGQTAVASGNFEVEEYKKPEYKVTVTTPKQFVPVGQKTTFSIEGRYFFGSPVTNAEVKYYIYRSRYYSWWWADQDADDLGDNSQAAGEETDDT
ncbi:MAG TPA: MG2 domain-containing protein, partial [Blastocatellia bacterium]|nr:MG2 domain-containing protein [Blastocatellia bacterium]